MKHVLITFLTLIALTSCHAAATHSPQERRELCEHFAGEEPYDKARAAYLNEMYEKLDCGKFQSGESAKR